MIWPVGEISLPPGLAETYKAQQKMAAQTNKLENRSVRTRMTALPEEALITEEEYERLEAQSPIKHEYLQGRMYAMPGGTRSHSEIAGNMYSSLRNRLVGRGCLPYNSDMRVKVEATGLLTYPDVSVACKDSRFEGQGETTLLDAIVVVEVLSSSTRTYDLVGKFEHYKQILSLRHILFIEPDWVQVDHWRRDSGQWKLERHLKQSEIIQLESLNMELPLEEIYFGQNVPEGVFLLPRPEAEA